jgi:HEAT repeat protein
MHRVSELFWRLLPAVRRSERSRAVFFAGLMTLLSAAQTLGLAGSEALLLANLGAERLPEAFIVAALVAVAGSLLYAWGVGAARNDRLFGWMLVGSALLLAAATPAAARGAPPVLIALFCAFYLTQAVFLNHFWTFSGDYFDTLTSKRLFPVFTVGSSVGGLLGALAAALGSRSFGAASLIAGWALLLGCAALLLRLARRPLHRWGPLELAESDETSMQGLRAAASHLRRTRFGRWLVLYSLGMVLALFIAQYLYSGLFAAAFPRPEALAMFLALYLAVTNLIEIALELWVTPWLIRRFGVPSAQLVHPLLVMASFGALAYRHGLAAGVAARVGRELVDNAVAQPIRSLVYNALPARLRGRIRAALEGVVVYAGMAGAGLLLLLLEAPEPFTLATLGSVAATLYLGAGLVVRREYLRELEDAIRAGRLDLSEVEGVGRFETEHLAQLAMRLLEEEAPRPSRSLLRLLPRLAELGALEPVRSGLRHPHSEVRVACVAAIGAARDPGDAAALREACADPDASVRRTALRALAGWAEVAEGARPELEARRRDPDPVARAEAAALSGADGEEWLRAMLRSSDVLEATAAAALAPAGFAAALAARARDTDPRVRAAVLERLAEVAPGTDLPEQTLPEALAAPDPRLRSAALRLLAHRPDTDPGRVARGLTDPALAPRGAAISALVARGEVGVRAAQVYLRDGRERAVRAALEVTARVDAPARREQLRRELLHHVRQLWTSELVLPLLPQESDTAATFLRLAWEDEAARHRRLAFRILGMDGNPRAIRNVYRALRFGARRARADALEVLSNLGDREAARLLVLRFEGPLDEEKRAAASALVPVPAERGALLALSRRAESLWIRAAAAALDPSLGHNAVGVATMERLLALRKVPLFESLTLDQLDAVDQLAVERDYQPGEVIVRQGEAGDELFMLLEGSVDVLLDHGQPTQERLRTLEAVDYFGEMAILDDQPRSATIVANRPSRLLALAGGSLKELILQMPDIAFEILRILSARVRSAEQRRTPR